MKAQELAVVSCRVGAVVLLVRGVLQFILSPFLFQGSFDSAMLLQWLALIIIPVALLVILAELLWRNAERLGSAIVPKQYADTAILTGISTQNLTAAAISVTGIALTAGVTPSGRRSQRSHLLLCLGRWKRLFSSSNPYNWEIMSKMRKLGNGFGNLFILLQSNTQKAF
jgi:hypothetical protein